MASQNKGILKDKKKRLGLNQCPDRLRGRHCKLFYDIDSNSYKIQDLGIGIGTFLRCDNRCTSSVNFNPA